MGIEMNEGAKKKECHFDADKEEGDLPLAHLERSMLDRRRYNPSIIVNTRVFRAPEKFLKDKV